MKKNLKKTMNRKARNVYETSPKMIRIKSRLATGCWIERKKGSKGGLIID